MKYFIIEQESQINSPPQLLNWRNVIDARDIKMGSYSKIPSKNMFFIKPDKEIEFPDVISHPFFIVTKDIKKKILSYCPNLVFKTFIYLDSTNGIMKDYYLPSLDEVDCLSDKSEVNLDRSILKKAVIIEEKIPDNPLFVLDNLTSRYVVVRMDLIESILKLDVKGISLKEIILV